MEQQQQHQQQHQQQQQHHHKDCKIRVIHHNNKDTGPRCSIITLNSKVMVLITPRLQQGFTLLEGLLGLSVLMGLLVLGSQHTQGRLEEQLCQSAAAHLRIVAGAAERYVLEHHGPGGAEAEQQQWQHEQQPLPDEERHSLERWRYQQLIDKRYLPEGFKPKNLYGQDYSLTVKHQAAPQPHQQLLVLTTRGQTIEERALRQIARQLGGPGGYISSNKDEKLNGDFCITGNQRGWVLPLPPETPYQPPNSPKGADPPSYPAPGHLASLSLLYDDEVLRGTTMLHRTANPNQPQLNQMETDLAMQQHQIIFNHGQHSGTVNAQKLELIAQQPGSGLYRQEIKLAITPEKVTFTGKSLPTQWHNQVTTYSAPELHRYWNKLPYYELRHGVNNSETEQFADEICATEVANQGEKFSTMGRLFMLGFDQHPESRIYLCGHAPRNHSASGSTGSITAGAKAQLLNTINHSYLQGVKDFSTTKIKNLKENLESACGMDIDDKQFEDIFKVLQRQPNESTASSE